MNNLLSETVFYSNYARWNGTKQRRETWDETTTRVIRFFKKSLAAGGNTLTDDVWMDLRDALLARDVLPSMRVIQMAGPALERCNVGAYNCAYLPLQDTQALAELLYILMQGTGVGFSVEHQYINQWPVISAQQNGNTQNTAWTVDDSTIGWCQAFQHGLNTWMAGGDTTFDYTLVRPYGAPLKTKGGKASGPEPLKNLLDFTRKMILAHQGRKLSSLNIHDLACYCGSIVQVGGVRRAAEISLSDIADTKIRGAKEGQFWLKAPERAMANNSAVFETKPSMNEFFDEWTALMNSGTGERGIFNREAATKGKPVRRAVAEFGTNPCGEIVLRPFQFCNLSIAVARPNDTEDSLLRKVRLAAIFGTLQSTLTSFAYIRPEWKSNCDEERLLGVDITGQMDCPLLNAGGYETGRVYTQLKHEVRETNEHFAKLLAIPASVATTCVKPSGNSSQLLDCSSGLHPRFAQYYIRRIRLASSNPVAAALLDHGVPVFPEVGQPVENPAIWVFEFPVKAPDGALVRKHLTALGQLEKWLTCKQWWCEHSASTTIYVREHEWMEVGAWVYRNWPHVVGLSFLPYDGGVYMLAPYEEITREQYEQKMESFPVLELADVLPGYEKGDETELNREFACTGDRCEI